METRVTFSCADFETADSILRPSGGRASTDTHIHSITTDVNSRGHKILMSALSEHGISFNEYRSWAFEERELQEAEYLELRTTGYWGFPQPEASYRSEYYDTARGCLICGSGLVQTRPFSTRGKPKFGRNDILAMNWTYELLVTERLRDLIRDADLSGVEPWPLVDVRKATPLEGYYQLAVGNTLPPMSESAGIGSPEAAGSSRYRDCANHLKMVGRMGKYGPVSLLRYNRKSLNAAKDFNKTNEYLSEGFDAHQWKVVSQRVRELLVRNGVKGAKFQPVIIEDDA